MELLDSDASPDYALQCIKWCAEHDETCALEEHLRLHKHKLKDELIPLLFESFSKRHTEVTKIILASLDQEIKTIKSENGKTWIDKLLLSAVEIGDTEIVKYLINKGASVNGNFYGKPVLHIGACYGHSDIVSELVNAGSDIHITDRCGEGIIHSILTSQLTSKGPLVRRVISLGANPLVKSSSGKFPIHLAAKNAPDVLAELLENGGDVHALDNVNKETPLHIACGAACRETILTLIQYGSRFNIENNHGQTPLAKLLRFTNSDHDFHTKTRLNIAKVLISIGFRINCHKTSSIFNKGRDKSCDRYISLKMSLQAPPPLQSLARATVRESLTSGSGLQKEVTKLDIPVNLKSYIMLKDLKL
ncbi:serine/threonine-protein phosphatase 6 regulatory ankyrin repeat subunit B-like [Mercenaria mercenaria]|uniref:serine/threonine-protein phosphatase 6 regulatory ankyrin repeat subunit B-like n=1 Tax=Mercenaria mercenaria TaxID=6596 RepID=UPI001E1D376C|nr:serine/threonine-protein phosphatase 6 regulatory ankyrin repeat subunit B-like [Mercenaria mercenaria]XP_045214348.1 serine/threonine-protein phosphatase 6 regulatory ankyrin repeat subunit B-like [Mercenaria mercenaria]XP_045214349.1 serine/threonine-protein phosphatase 6 regulatory ankyrin repeat subunit B-like [Mercenaria mercenaria]